MSVFRLIEGLIQIRRPPQPLPYFSQGGVFAPAADVLFDFAGIKKDVKIQTGRPITLRFNTLVSDVISLGSGEFNFTEQWANKVYVTFLATPSTQFSILAHG